MVYFIGYYVVGVTTAILGMLAFYKGLDRRYSMIRPTPFTYGDLALVLLLFWIAGPLILFTETIGNKPIYVRQD